MPNRKPRVLIACEFSGRITEAMHKIGIEAISCDFRPTMTPQYPHIQGDVRPILRQEWDLVVAHPPCTRLCLSGVRWLHERDLWDELKQGAEFFLECLNANSPKIGVENPQMHGYAHKLIGRKPNFYVQPWMFGDLYSKKTCFHTRGLDPLRSEVPWMKAKDYKDLLSYECHEKLKGIDRAITYPGIARAIAEQWGRPLLNAKQEG